MRKLMTIGNLRFILLTFIVLCNGGGYSDLHAQPSVASLSDGPSARTPFSSFTTDNSSSGSSLADAGAHRLAASLSSAASSQASSSRKVSRRGRVAVKTNTLGLGLLMANMGVEINISRHLSFHVPVYYSGIDISETVKFRTLAAQPELRWHFTPSDGFFIGAHASAAYFNMAFGGDRRYQDHLGETPLIGGGLSLGYRLRFAEGSHWGMEFVVGAGACRLEYDRFVNGRNGLYIDTVDKTYIGPDNAAISVFYEFGLGRGRRR